MAKSSRASSRKANNQRLKAKVFGPVEAARSERLSARLLELAAQPKPETPESETMAIIDGGGETEKKDDTTTAAVAAVEDESAMDIDTAKDTSTTSRKANTSRKGRIEKRKKTNKIVFPKYSDKNKKKRKN
ncbi:hypothetical protein F5Y16DRAFT_298474 [Xylariaceae sp. FL0255]|nr:hypothetical protein F5Y16DRAFT_298474 [Xylariaceae sp. FL0255]